MEAKSLGLSAVRCTGWLVSRAAWVIPATCSKASSKAAARAWGLEARVWVLGFGFWVLGFGFWV